MGEFASNLATDQPNALGSAYKSASTNVNEMANCMQFNVYSDDNTAVTAGLSPFDLGFSINYYQKAGDFNINASAGLGLISGPFANAGVSYNTGDWVFSVGGGLSENSYSYGGTVKYGAYGVGYYQTHYGDALGPDGKPNNQVVGGINIYLGDVSLRIENDLLGDRHDRWRSSAAEIGIGNFLIGTKLYNNNPEGENQRVIMDGTDRMGNKNNPPYGAWANGKVYNSPLWIGARWGNSVERIGYSHPMVQDRTQNWVHRNGFFYLPFGHANFFVDDSKFTYGLTFSTGYFNPYSLWGMVQVR